ncbi:Uncharacterized protein Fot_09008 [Forsythia ovata]|uniref:Uncharacterized protein n=1 Tax=Forsythia ovata TaxID=205694 RepID=A0ABD1WF83_9LAMI
MRTITGRASGMMCYMSKKDGNTATLLLLNAFGEAYLESDKLGGSRHHSTQDCPKSPKNSPHSQITYPTNSLLQPQRRTLQNSPTIRYFEIHNKVRVKYPSCD